MHKLAFVGLLIISSACAVHGQDNSWTFNNNSNINWYEITSFGPIVIGTDKSLAAVDPKTKKTLWELPNYPKLDTISVDIKKDVPFIKIAIHDTISVDTNKAVKKKGGFFSNLGKLLVDPDNTQGRGHKHVREQWVNYLNGQVVFDTKDGGIQYLNYVRYFLTSGHVILEGFNGDSSVLCCVSMANRKKLWQIKKPGFVKKSLLGNGNQLLYIDADVNGNYIMVNSDSLFCINGKDGSSIWRNSRSGMGFAVINKKPFLFGYKNDTLVRMNSGTGVVEKTITTKDNVTPYLALHDKDLFPNEALRVMKQPVNITVADTVVVLEGSYGFITIGQSMNGINNNEGYAVGNMYRFNKLIPLRDSSLIALFTDPNPSFLGQGLMRFNRQYKSLWIGGAKPVGGIMRRVYIHDETLIAVTNRGFKVIDANTGLEKKIIGKNIPKLDSTFLFAENPAGTYCCFYQSGSLYQLEYKTMQATEILNKTGFKGSDPEDKMPVLLEGLENGWFLGAGQNMLLMDYNGKVVYNQYFDRPGMSIKGLKLLASIGGLVAGYMFRDAASTVTDVYYNLGEINSDEYVNLKTWDYMAGGTGSAAVTSDVAKNMVGNNGSRNTSKLVTNNNDYQLVFGKQDGKPCLFEIDKKNGNTKLMIPMSSKKQKMETDTRNRGIFTINEDGKTFEYYALQ